ncbi:hypothetical protein [Alicyclobacillus acidiphilus]|uniref:hypothetical protein n=1 Tax=Alicyclobacillus acidiphilus TaxID=182455 RepID=UPI00082E6C2D|nr:hypothetical protein [Alicyclobacillus acidiphilus]
MGYKTNAVPTVAPFGALIIIWVPLGNSLPNPYKDIVWMIGSAYLIAWVGFAFFLASKYRRLSITECELTFPKTAFKAENVRKIRVFDRSATFLVYFKERKYPLTISFSLADADKVIQELRGWAWRNGVTLELASQRRKR